MLSFLNCQTHLSNVCVTGFALKEARLRLSTNLNPLPADSPFL